MVWPERPGAKWIRAPEGALAMAARSEPDPESTAVVTVSVVVAARAGRTEADKPRARAATAPASGADDLARFIIIKVGCAEARASKNSGRSPAVKTHLDWHEYRPILRTRKPNGVSKSAD